VLSGLLLLILMLEAIAYVVLYFIAKNELSSPAHTIGAIFGMALIWRLTVVLLSFLVSGAWRVGNFSQGLKAFLGESAVSLYLYSFAQPLFASLRWIRRTWETEAKSNVTNGPVVVLVHGFLCNAGMWGGVRRALKNSGIASVYSVTLDPFYTSMPRSLRVFERKLQRILQISGGQRVVLIGHSMGGVLGRLFVHRRARFVEKLICVGAPHAGTTLSYWVASRKCGPARPDTRWLAAFRSNAVKCAVPMLNIWSTTDNIVSPQDSAKLTVGAEQILNDVGHLQLVFDQRALKTITTFVLEKSDEARHASTRFHAD
jgi:hypothetical protein